MIREGLQDYEYLEKLKLMDDGAFVQAELAQVVTAAYQFDSDPSTLDRVRGELADEIERLLGTGAADAGISVDAGSAVDAGGRLDGGSLDAGSPLDGAGGAALGGGASKAAGGCGCAHGPVDALPEAMLWAGLLAALALRRQRVSAH